MKLIKPSEISGKIMTLIEEADKFMVIVSPYNNIEGWKKLNNKIEKARDRGVDISWYSRLNGVSTENSEQIRKIGIEPHLLANLHTKLYMNDGNAIITSMNLSRSSDDNSLDIGIITTDEAEYSEIYEYFKVYIEHRPKIAKSDTRYVDNAFFNDLCLLMAKEFSVDKFSYSLHSTGPTLKYHSFPVEGLNTTFETFKHYFRINIHVVHPEAKDLIKLIASESKQISEKVGYQVDIETWMDRLKLDLFQNRSGFELEAHTNKDLLEIKPNIIKYFGEASRSYKRACSILLK